MSLSYVFLAAYHVHFSLFHFLLSLHNCLLWKFVCVCLSECGMSLDYCKTETTTGKRRKLRGPHDAARNGQQRDRNPDRVEKTSSVQHQSFIGKNRTKNSSEQVYDRCALQRVELHASPHFTLMMRWIMCLARVIRIRLLNSLLQESRRLPCCEEVELVASASWLPPAAKEHPRRTLLPADSKTTIQSPAT